MENNSFTLYWQCVFVVVQIGFGMKKIYCSGIGIEIKKFLMTPNPVSYINCGDLSLKGQEHKIKAPYRMKNEAKGLG